MVEQDSDKPKQEPRVDVARVVAEALLRLTDKSVPNLGRSGHDQTSSAIRDESRDVIVDLLYAALTPRVCHRLGIWRWPPGFMLSVVIPVYNEAGTIAKVIERVESVGIPHELIIIDDASSDDTAQVLDRLETEYEFVRLSHPQNRGKGAAIRTGLARVKGDVVIIQDADLEYDPNDIPLLLGPILEDRADVVYGSRFSSNDRPVSRYWHQTANRIVTLLSNMFTNLKLSDVETCYKVVRRETLNQIAPSLRENGFGIELELTAKLARIPDVRFHEMPVSYSPRGYAEGKKIGWVDAIRAIWCVFRYAFLNRFVGGTGVSSRELEAGEPLRAGAQR